MKNGPALSLSLAPGGTTKFCVTQRGCAIAAGMHHTTENRVAATTARALFMMDRPPKWSVPCLALEETVSGSPRSVKRPALALTRWRIGNRNPTFSARRAMGRRIVGNITPVLRHGRRLPAWLPAPVRVPPDPRHPGAAPAEAAAPRGARDRGGHAGSARAAPPRLGDGGDRGGDGGADPRGSQPRGHHGRAAGDADQPGPRAPALAQARPARLIAAGSCSPSRLVEISARCCISPSSAPRLRV